MKIHHLGLVVTDVDEALAALGLSRLNITETIFDTNQKNNLHFIHLPENNLWIELVEPRAEDASTAKFAKKFSIGLHHLAMTTEDLETIETMYTSRPGNFVLGRYQINVDSFGGKIRTLFIAVKGLILEFVKVEK
ncbi:VOC family protein [Leptospira noguchii]|uniref:Glyoxalase/bleomycin resistance protein/dioxygenase family protein n=1 Tax=Leptospira noguchii serovar Panama str. CZ214 TaxID=1001595 RepID=T0FIY2_9LEPT|nr:VOC family protein [Leptospira noguchii]EQA70029.1 glyoxalase/bleomycin resistance protein/dioxygenase family protein [Leptospira noguchii serovar Panama str. CZ214]MCH1913316.1 VOC family protein [Leptospira noguchii]MCH1915421.1 VOC family protein [Leptospira noguchii]UOG65270.1 VOC family protein [Leptospira noguchii]